MRKRLLLAPGELESWWRGSVIGRVPVDWELTQGYSAQNWQAPEDTRCLFSDRNSLVSLWAIHYLLRLCRCGLH